MGAREREFLKVCLIEGNRQVGNQLSCRLMVSVMTAATKGAIGTYLSEGSHTDLEQAREPFPERLRAS